MSTDAHNGETLKGQKFDQTHDLEIPFTQRAVQRSNEAAELGGDAKDIDPIDGAASLVRTFSTPIADGDVLQGQDFDPENDVFYRYSQQAKRHSTAADDLGDASKEVQPIDKYSALVRIWDTAAIASALAAKANAFAIYVDFNLPDSLLSVVAGMGANNGNGEHDEVGEGFSGGTSGSLSLNLTSRSQGSASVAPYIVATIRPNRARRVPATAYTFFEPNGVTHAEVLARLTTLAGATVNTWPKFNETPHTFTLLGQQISVAVNVNVQQHKSFSPGNVTMTNGSGQGDNVETGLSVRHDHIPPTIHPLITVTGTLYNEISASAEAHAAITSGENWPSKAVGPHTRTVSAIGQVLPSSLAATAGQATIPTSGLYLMDPVPRPFRNSHVFYTAIVVDFNYFA